MESINKNDNNDNNNNNNNKRGDAAVDDEAQSLSTKRQCRSSDGEDPKHQKLQQQQRPPAPPAANSNEAVTAAAAAATAVNAARQSIAELKRQQTISDDRLAELKRQQDEEQRHRDRVANQLASAEQQLARAERQQQRLRHSVTEDPRIQEALRTYKTGTVPLDVLLDQQYSDFVDSIDFWWAFLDNSKDLPLSSRVYELFFDKEPPTVMRNKELMLQLCKYDPRIYLAIPFDWRLKGDTDIVEAVLQLNPSTVAGLPDPVQLQNPSFVGKAFARLPLHDSDFEDYFAEDIHNDVWSNRDVILGWIKVGGQLRETMPENLRQDPEIVLAALGNRIPSVLPTFIPDLLEGDLEFMKKAVEKDPLALNFVAQNLKRSKDLAIAALSGKNDIFAFQKYIFTQAEHDDDESNNRHDRRFWVQVGESVRQQLRLHDSFVKLVLGSIHFSESKPSDLAVLDQGKATSKACMEHIAGFAGVPVGEELGKLLRARKNLAIGGIHWYD